MGALDDLKNKNRQQNTTAEDVKRQNEKPLVTGSGDNQTVEQPTQPLDGKLQGNDEMLHTDYVPPEARNALQTPVEDDEILYTCPHSEQFSIQLSTGEVRAKDGLLRVSEEEHQEIQKLIKSGRPDIAQNAIYLDKAAAEAIAKEYLARQKRPVAHQGSVHSKAGVVEAEAQHANNRDFAAVAVKEDGSFVTSATHDGSAQSILANAVAEGVVHAEDGNMNPETNAPVK